VPKRPPSKREAAGGDKPPLDAAAARGRALKLLSRREHSAAELAFKLKRRGAGADVAVEAVAAMADAGWQSDTRYAEMLLRNRSEQGYGPRRIRADLEAARVPEVEIRRAFDEADYDWRQRCAEVWQRKFKSAPRTASDWQKHYRFLAGRGFGSEAIRAVLKDAPDDVDDFSATADD